MSDVLPRAAPGRVFVISELYAPEDTSTGYFLTRIAEGLATEFEVHVFCGQPTYAARGVRAPVRERLNGVDVRRCRATTFNKDVLPLRLVNLITISVSMFWRALHDVRHGDIVLVVTNPPSLPFLAAVACKLRGGRSVLIVHDLYPEVLTAAGMIRPGSWLERFGLRLNKWLYRTMDRIVVLGRDMAERAAPRLPLEARNHIVLIPHWGDVDEIHPAPTSSNALISRLNLDGMFVVQFAGNMGRTHDLETVVDAAARLREDAGITFLLIGSGGKSAYVRRAVDAQGLSNVRLLGYQPRADLPMMLTACDVAMVPLVRGLAGISVPSRFYNILAAGRPVIVMADAHAEPAMIVREEDIGWVVSPGDTDGLLSAIQDARRHPEETLAKGRRARAVAETKYLYAQTMTAYHAMVRDLGGSSASTETT